MGPRPSVAGLLFVSYRDDVHGLAMIADRPAEQDETLGHEAVHERCMRLPGPLLADVE